MSEVVNTILSLSFDLLRIDTLRVVLVPCLSHLTALLKGFSVNALQTITFSNSISLNALFHRSGDLFVCSEYVEIVGWLVIIPLLPFRLGDLVQ